MDIRYAAKRNGKWLQGIEANPDYKYSAYAPTMGNRHTYSEYRTIWGTEQKWFERMTFVGYLQVLFEEYRWGDKKHSDFSVRTMMF